MARAGSGVDGTDHELAALYAGCGALDSSRDLVGYVGPEDLPLPRLPIAFRHMLRGGTTARPEYNARYAPLRIARSWMNIPTDRI